MKRFTYVATFIVGFLVMQSASAVLMTSTINFLPDAGSQVTFEWNDANNDCDSLALDTCTVTNLDWQIGTTTYTSADVTGATLGFGSGGEIVEWYLAVAQDSRVPFSAPDGNSYFIGDVTSGAVSGETAGSTLVTIHTTAYELFCFDAGAAGPLCSAAPSSPQTRTGVGSWTTTTVPEPTTLALMGLGLAGVGWTRRKRTQ